MIDTIQLKADYLSHLVVKNREDRAKRRVKSTFWASDCLRPSIEIYWAWKQVPQTEPIEDEKLSMFKSADADEHEAIKNLTEMGICVPVSEDNPFNLTVATGQYYVSMIRNGAPISGKMDGVTVDGVPVEVKTHWWDGVDKKFDKGEPPSEHYLHQLAVYVDYMDAPYGIMVHRNRSNGRMFFFVLNRTNNLEFECNGFRFNLADEYERWGKLYSENIVPDVEPALEYYYRPLITKELLDHYNGSDNGKKIILALKGRRVLSDHQWRPQYCNWKTLWIEKEMKEKGFDNVNDMLPYSPSEILMMMEYLGKEARIDKNGVLKFFKAKDEAKIVDTVQLVVDNRETVDGVGVTEEDDAETEEPNP